MSDIEPTLADMELARNLVQDADKRFFLVDRVLPLARAIAQARSEGADAQQKAYPTIDQARHEGAEAAREACAAYCETHEMVEDNISGTYHVFKTTSVKGYTHQGVLYAKELRKRSGTDE